MRIKLDIIGFVLMIIALALAANLVAVTPSSVTQTAMTTSPFVYSFNTSGILNETGSLLESSSPYWWINSGGQLIMDGGIGATMQGTAPLLNPWRVAYAAANPVDTDNGTHPQNLFRLITKSQWDTVRAESSFYIVRDNFSSSPNRNESNGLLLFNRYKDSQTLYYTGVRVDGTAVIKKKYRGTYYTMAQKPVFAGTYNAPKDTKNLLPHQTWFALRSETRTNTDGNVTLALFMRYIGSNTWTKLLEATDSGQYGGTIPITGSGSAGIRTDFMDVRIDSFRLENLP